MKRFLWPLLVLWLAAGLLAPAAPVLPLHLDIQTPQREFQQKFAAGSTPTLRAYVYDDGAAYTNLAGWTGLVFYAVSATQGVYIGSSGQASNYVDFFCSADRTATVGTFSAQVILSDGTNVLEWGRGSLVLRDSPATMGAGSLTLTTLIDWDAHTYTGTAPWPTNVVGDGLGNHIATGDLNMAGHSITNIGTNSLKFADGLTLSSDGTRLRVNGEGLATTGDVAAVSGDNLGDHTATEALQMGTQTIATAHGTLRLEPPDAPATWQWVYINGGDAYDVFLDWGGILSGAAPEEGWVLTFDATAGSYEPRIPATAVSGATQIVFTAVASSSNYWRQVSITGLTMYAVGCFTNGGSGSGDNLGDHTATDRLYLADQPIVGSSSNLDLRLDVAGGFYGLATFSNRNVGVGVEFDPLDLYQNAGGVGVQDGMVLAMTNVGANIWRIRPVSAGASGACPNTCQTNLQPQYTIVDDGWGNTGTVRISGIGDCGAGVFAVKAWDHNATNGETDVGSMAFKCWSVMEYPNVGELLHIDPNWTAAFVKNASVLIDQSGADSVDYHNRMMYDAGELTSVAYDARELHDTMGIDAVNWGSRVLNDSSGNAAVDWENGDLGAVFGITTNIQVTTPAGTKTFCFTNGLLKAVN
jgi:hypothetical protein